MGSKAPRPRPRLEPLFVRVPKSLKDELEEIYPRLGYKDLSELVRDILRKYVEQQKRSRG